MNHVKPWIVLDTNVLVSAVIVPKSIPAQALRYAIKYCDIYVSESTMTELIQVLNRPKFDKYFAWHTYTRNEFIEYFVASTNLVPITTTVTDCNDPKDNQFLEVAISAGVKFLVTGDKKDLLSMHPYKNISIISASQFISYFQNW